MENLSEFELSTAKEIVNIGLAKAADSLSFFLREKVLIKSIDFELKKVIDAPHISSKSGTHCTVLITEMAGEIQGSSYFIFSDEEVQKVLDVSIPPNPSAKPEGNEIMKKALLLEIDNIITAAVVTQFANMLGFRIYGSVPTIQRVKSSELNKIFKSESNNDSYIIKFKTEFISSQKDFKPEFIWLLDAAFIDAVKKFVSQKENLK